VIYVNVKLVAVLAFASLILGGLTAEPLYNFIRTLLPDTVQYTAFNPFDGFMILMYIGISVSVIFFFFGVLFLLWKEYNDALHLKEKEFILKSLTPSIILFVIGIVFGVGVYTKLMLPFFIQTNVDMGLTNNWNLNNVITQGIGLSFMLGIAFQLPVILRGLIKLGVVTKDQLRKQRGIVVIGILIISAIITPTPDILSQLIVGLPLYALFEVSIL